MKVSESLLLIPGKDAALGIRTTTCKEQAVCYSIGFLWQ